MESEAHYMLYSDDVSYSRLLNELNTTFKKRQYNNMILPSEPTQVSKRYNDLPNLIKDKDTGHLMPSHSPNHTLENPLNTLQHIERESENTGYPLPPDPEKEKLCCKCVIS